MWAHISGSDLVRDGDGTVYVLEDNLRVPSGVSYMLENRSISKRVFAELFEQPEHPAGRRLHRPAATSCWRRSRPTEAHDADASSCSRPGIYNSAYFEHCFLAQQMGVPLVEGRDLFVGDDDVVYMRTDRRARSGST